MCDLACCVYTLLCHLEDICPVPDGIAVPVLAELCPFSHFSDWQHQEVFFLAEQESLMVVQHWAVASTVTNYDFVNKLGVIDIRDIKQRNLYSCCGHAAKVAFRCFFANADYMVLIIGVQVVAEARYLQFAKDLWISWVRQINHKERVSLPECYHVQLVSKEPG